MAISLRPVQVDEVQATGECQRSMGNGWRWCGGYIDDAYRAQFSATERPVGPGVGRGEQQYCGCCTPCACGNEPLA